MKYVDSKWQTVEMEDKYKLTKMEGQVSVAHSSYTALMLSFRIMTFWTS
jgi:hypothetical protein